MRVLLIDGEQPFAELACKQLEEAGYSVQLCRNGSDGLRAAEQHAFDLILLDVALPFLSGLEVTRRLRQHGVAAPILFLTARSAAQDVVSGLDSGADDYLIKPISFEVLEARIRAHLRRVNARSQTRLRFCDLSLETTLRKAWRGEQEINLSPTEYAILESLMYAAGRLVTRMDLIQSVWRGREISNSTLDKFIRTLREKVDLPDKKKLIHSERGIGFRLLDR